MIEHVFRRVIACDVLDTVYIATCDDEIRLAAESFGGNPIMTSPAHERASDRVAEAAEIIELAGEPRSGIVVMIQGDEPMITAGMIEMAVAPMLIDPAISCVNLVRRIQTQAEQDDPNTIKVVMNIQGEALYFSRAPIPLCDWSTDQSVPVFKQVCVIPFRRDFLREFSQLAPTPLEKAESIDMLRAVEHGRRVHLVETEVETHAVDTVEDLILVEGLMREGELTSSRVTPGSEA
jgi:3-deoxy-manno-octulosonate cytidylyltransferase (CMP-KDO synthetase)